MVVGLTESMARCKSFTYLCCMRCHFIAPFHAFRETSLALMLQIPFPTEKCYMVGWIIYGFLCIKVWMWHKENQRVQKNTWFFFPCIMFVYHHFFNNIAVGDSWSWVVWLEFVVPSCFYTLAHFIFSLCSWITPLA